MNGDFRLGLGMFAFRAVLRAQGLLGDPAGRVLGRGPSADPYRRYEQVRAGGDLVHSRLGVYLTASHELVNSVLRDSRFGVLEAGGARPMGYETVAVNPIEESFLSLDPPTHTRLRRQVAPWFTPRALREQAERIEAVAHRNLDELAGGDSFDLIGDFAVRVPIQVICELLGVPDAEYPRFVRWGSVLALALDATWTLSNFRKLRAVLDEMSAFFTELVAHRRNHPGDDIVSALANEEMVARDLLATVELLLVAGFETTVNLIGNGVVELLRNDEARAWLLAHPDRAEDLVEEILRYDSPVQFTMRIAHEPVTLAGRTLPRNTNVVLLLAGANRDPDVFEHPERFDPLRANNREHVAFSAGIHYCLGAGLARIEAAVALRALFERYPDLRAAGPAQRRRSRNLRGVKVLPVRGKASTLRSA